MQAKNKNTKAATASAPSNRLMQSAYQPASCRTGKMDRCTAVFKAFDHSQLQNNMATNGTAFK